MRASITLALAALVALASPARAGAQVLEEYVVREGEDCGTIAARRYGSPRRYDRIHEHNPQLGPLPHRLRAGTVLHLPPAEAAAPSADAIVTDARGSVRSQEPTTTSWSGARIGEELYSGWRVSTGERSSAELTFRTSSVAAVRAETLVIVHGSSVERVREEGTRAVLREGSMLSRLSSLSGGAPLTVETPTAEVVLEHGEATVRVTSNDETAISAHSGRPARVRRSEGGRAAGDAVEVPEGHGSRVSRGAPPTPPRPLPAAPAWAPEQSAAFLGLTGVGGTMRGRWLPVEGARGYRVEIARREDGRDLVFAAEVPATVTAFEAHRFPAGAYYLRLTTIDDAFFEGRATVPVALQVVDATLVPPGAVPPGAPAQASDALAVLEALDALGDAALLEDAAPPVPEVLVGTRVLVPEGVVCAMGASEPAHELVLAAPGEGYLTCVDAAGANVTGLEVRVVGVRAALLAEDGGELPPLVRGERRAARLVVREGEVDVASLALEGDARVQIELGGLHPEGGLAVALTPAIDAPDALSLGVALRGSESAALGGSESAALGTVAVRTIAAEPSVVEPPPVIRVPAPPRPIALHEAMGLLASPSWVGLRDEQREGSGGWIAITGASARLGEPDPRLRLVAGVQAGLWDELLRLSAVAPLDVIGQAARSADRGARDVQFALGSRVIDASRSGGFGLALEAAVWAPTAGAQGLDHGRLSVSADLSLRFAERFAVRARQAGIFDLVDAGSLLWASAWGLDVAIVGPLSAGLEGTMTIGREDDRDWYAGGVGLGVGIDLAPVMISLGGRYGFGDDLWPTLTLAANARVSF